jgi:hypothetical protein
VLFEKQGDSNITIQDELSLRHMAQSSDESVDHEPGVKVPLLDLSVLHKPKEQPLVDAKVPMLNLGKAQKPAMGLNLQGIKKDDFHDEFMGNLDNFSQSWRDAALREKRY